MKRWTILAAAVVAALGLAPAARAGTVVSQTYTNTTAVGANDFHWPFSPWTLTAGNISGGAFLSSNTQAMQATNKFLISFSNGFVGSGNQNTVGVTFDQAGYGQYTASWTNDGIVTGSAGTPHSLHGSYGHGASEWTVAIDNRDWELVADLVVSGLRFAVTNIIYNPGDLASQTFAWGPVEPTFMIAEGDERAFQVPVAGPDEYVVLECEMWNDGAYDDTLCSVRAEVFPEPATLSLLAVGALALLRRRR
jgi:hypothetical protein